MKFNPNTTFLNVLIILLVASCTSPQPDKIELIKKDLYFLASDSLSGREIGSEGERIAADYIATQFETIGLKPAGTEGYLQTFFVEASSNPHEEAIMKAYGDSSGVKGINVMGMIEGKGDEIIILGAHFDHLGMGGSSSLERGDSAVHNGADDNASGTSGLIQMARYLSEQELNRSVLFLAFSGEEKGLWGSNYFAKNPTVDLAKVNYMINMDMIGRLDTTRALAISGIGTAPIWSGVIDIANTDSIPLTLTESGTGPSDHTSFYLQDIPVLHFFTGQHADYHKPTDDADKINYRGIVKVTNMIQRLVIDLDDEDQLSFTKTKDESTDNPRFTVGLGVVPDYLFGGPGMRIDGVSEDKPAQRAGILKGDIVIQLGDSTITDMMSYMRALSVFEKGDQATVVVTREDEELIFTVDFN
jgi:hypothetical protein